MNNLNYKGDHSQWRELKQILRHTQKVIKITTIGAIWKFQTIKQVTLTLYYTISTLTHQTNTNSWQKSRFFLYSSNLTNLDERFLQVSSISGKFGRRGQHSICSRIGSDVYKIVEMTKLVLSYIFWLQIKLVSKFYARNEILESVKLAN